MTEDDPLRDYILHGGMRGGKTWMMDNIFDEIIGQKIKVEVDENGTIYSSLPYDLESTAEEIIDDDHLLPPA